MEKVICLKCNDIGYTASPQLVRCQCGGNLNIISEENQELIGRARLRPKFFLLDGHVMFLEDSLLKNHTAEVKEYETITRSS